MTAPFVADQVSEPQAGVLLVKTVLFCDLVDSTALVSRLGDVPASTLLEAIDLEAKALVAKLGGVVRERSDGFGLLFDRPLEALSFALEYHHLLRRHGRRSGIILQARVGIHLGEVVKSDGDGLHGLAFAVAARVMSLAGGEQTLLTRGAFDLARRGAVGSALEARPLRWLAHGMYALQGVDEPESIFEVGEEGVAPLTAPETSAKAKRAWVSRQEDILGWRPAVGQTLPNREEWVLVERLGEGGFGEVWLVRHRLSAEARVFKFCFHQSRLRALKRELTILRILKESLGERRDIARIVDWNLEDEPYYIEFLQTASGDMVTWATAQGGITSVPLAERIRLVALAARAVGASHSVGVLHKDIKPSNLLVVERTGERYIQITDFGVGYLTEEAAARSPSVTRTGMTEVLDGHGSSQSGTRLYLSPEQLEGRDATTRSDVYSLGVLLYQCAVGDLSRAVGTGWEREVEDQLLRRDIAQAIDRDPRHRFASADQLAEQLEQLGERRIAEEASRRQEEEKARFARESASAKRRRRLLVAVAVTSSAITVAVSAVTVVAVRQRSEALEARELAERERREAELARQEARANREQLANQLYRTNMDLASRLLADGNISQAWKALRSAPPELRSMEWGLLAARCFPELYRHQLTDDRPAEVGFVDNNTVAFITTNRRLALFHLDTLTEESIPGMEGSTPWTALATSPAHALIAGGSHNGDLIIQRIGSGPGAAVRVPWIRAEPVTALAFSRDGKVLFSGHDDGTLQELDLTTLTVRRSVKAGDKMVNTITPSPDGKLVAAGGNDYTGWLWMPDNAVRYLEGHGAPLWSAKFTEDGTRLLTTAADTSARVWDVATGQELKSLEINTERDHLAHVHTGIWKADQQAAIFTAADGEVSCWDTKLGIRLHRFEGHEGPVVDADLSPDGAVLATASHDGTLRFWEVENPLSRIRLPLMGSRRFARQFLADSHTLLTTSHDNTARLWDADRGTEQLRLHPFGERYDFCKGGADPTGQFIVTVARDNSARLWRATTGEELFVVTHTSDIEDAAVSTAGRQIATVAVGAAILTNVEANERIAMKSPPVRGTCIRYSPDEKLVAVGWENGQIHLYDTATGQQRLSIGTGLHWVEAIAFSPDGSRLAGASLNGNGYIWEVASGRQLAILTGHTAWLSDVAFTPDGSRVVTASNDDTIRFWDAENGAPLGWIRAEGHGVDSLTISRDQKLIALTTRSQLPEVHSVFPLDADKSESLQNWQKAHLAFWLNDVRGANTSAFTSRLRHLNNLPSKTTVGSLSLIAEEIALATAPVPPPELEQARAILANAPAEENTKIVELLGTAANRIPPPVVQSPEEVEQDLRRLETLFAGAVTPPLLRIGANAVMSRQPQLRLLCLTAERGDDVVYISGDRPELANWSTNFVPIRRLTENEAGIVWHFDLDFRPMEFKYTRGLRGEGWDTAEWPGPPNRVIDLTTPLYVDATGRLLHLAVFGAQALPLTEAIDGSAPPP